MKKNIGTCLVLSIFLILPVSILGHETVKECPPKSNLPMSEDSDFRVSLLSIEDGETGVVKRLACYYNDNELFFSASVEPRGKLPPGFCKILANKETLPDLSDLLRRLGEKDGTTLDGLMCHMFAMGLVQLDIHHGAENLAGVDHRKTPAPKPKTSFETTPVKVASKVRNRPSQNH